MQNILSSFISEVGGQQSNQSKSSTPAKRVSLSSSKDRFPNTHQKPGTLLLTSCNDWDNQTKSNANGLDEPHKVVFPPSAAASAGTHVRKCFSSSSSMHSFVLMEDGSLTAMGKNDNGQLGTGDFSTAALPVAVPLEHPLKHKISIVKVATGRSHSLILTAAGEVFGCGAHNYGQLGLGEQKSVVNKKYTKFVPIPLPEDVVIRDIACGYDFSVLCDRAGCVWTFGHPEYGQLGHGSTGEQLQEGKTGIQYQCEYRPRRVVKYVTKDAHHKTTFELHYCNIRMRSVAAGRNHVICVEDWELDDDEAGAASSATGGSNSISRDAAYEPMNRVYSWGFGGYGRLGHNASADELFPREIVNFSHYSPQTREQSLPPNTQKQVRSIVCGSTFSMAVSVSKHMYFWGKTSKAQRGEATVYPYMVQELYDYPVLQCAAGNNCIFVIAESKRSNYGGKASSSSKAESSGSSSVSVDRCCIAWGQSVAGRFGLEDGSKSTVHPKFVTALEGLELLDVDCGYGHVSFVVCGKDTIASSDGSSGSSSSGGDGVDKLSMMPALHVPVAAAAAGAGKKRARDESAKTASKASKTQKKK